MEGVGVGGGMIVEGREVAGLDPPHFKEVERLSETAGTTDRGQVCVSSLLLLL